MPIRSVLVAFALALLSAPVFAADAPPPLKPMMGTVVSLKGDTLVLKEADGKQASLTLSAKAGISRTKIGKVSDIKSGQFIGCTAVEGPDGKLRAQEVHIFPESMRGTGEGHYPWGNQAKTTMTNGDVKQMEGVASGDTIKVTYKNGDKTGETTISILPSTRVTIIESATRADLTPGTNVSVFMGKDESGKPVAMGVGIAPKS